MARVFNGCFATLPHLPNRAWTNPRVQASVAAPKVSSIFQEKIVQILALKIESIRNFATIFKVLA